MQQPSRSRRSVLVALAGGAASAAFPALGPVAGVPQQADHPDLPLAAGRLDRPASAHPGRDRRPPPRPDRRRREQAGRRRHDRPRHDGAHRQARRLHHLPVPDGHAAPAAHAEDAVGSARPTSPSSSASRATPSASRSAPTRPTRPSTSTSRRRGKQPRHDQLRLHRRRHLAAPADGRARRQCQGAAQPRAVQGQRRPAAGAARRPRHGAERRLGLGQVRRRRADAPARHLRREAHQALADGADRAGARLRRGLDLALRLRRARRAWTRR